jgi:hypothetical protein
MTRASADYFCTPHYVEIVVIGGGKTMFCKKCGSEIPDDSKFCQKCGEKIAAMPPSQPSPVLPAKQFQPNPPKSKLPLFWGIGGAVALIVVVALFINSNSGGGGTQNSGNGGGVASSNSSSSSSSNSVGGASNRNNGEIAIGELVVLSNYTVEIKNYRIVHGTGYEDSDYILITYEWTNNGNYSNDFGHLDSVFQTGLECPRADYLTYNTDDYLSRVFEIEGFDSSGVRAKDIEIQPGISQTVQSFYELYDTTSPLDIRIGYDLDNQTYTLHISNASNSANNSFGQTNNGEDIKDISYQGIPLITYLGMYRNEIINTFGSSFEDENTEMGYYMAFNELLFGFDSEYSNCSSVMAFYDVVRFGDKALSDYHYTDLMSVKVPDYMYYYEYGGGYLEYDYLDCAVLLQWWDDSGMINSIEINSNYNINYSYYAEEMESYYY